LQVPALQTSPAAHCTPQPPQLNGSPAVLTQELPQRIVPCGHWQAPATHEAVGAHVVPHAPQFAVSFDVTTHALLQTVVPCGQVATHWPRLQSSPAATLHA
jgi:hypothetical protein